MRPLERLSDRLERIETRLQRKADEVSGVKVIREFLATGRDAYAHLPLSPEPNSIRWHLFGRRDDDAAAP
jgi:hypothetical protein